MEEEEKMDKKTIILKLCFLVISSCAFAQTGGNETITIATYYPSPHGVYGVLNLFPKDLEPQNPMRGDIYFNNITQNMMYYKNDIDKWQNLTGGGGGVAGGWEYNITTGHVYNVNTGNIGIGTRDPEHKLHIIGLEDGTSPHQRLLSLRGDGTINLHMSSASNTFHDECQIESNRARGRISNRLPLLKDDHVFEIEAGGYTGDINNLYSVGGLIKISADEDFSPTSAPGRIEFHTTPINSITPVNRMVIKNDGQVQIGSSANPGQLDVYGDINRHGYNIYADYVFEPDYKLESIDEHTKYMWKHKRLKALPQSELDENGQQISEISNDMMGILEELEKAHIYISHLNEKVKGQDKEIESLKKEIDTLKAKK